MTMMKIKMICKNKWIKKKHTEQCKETWSSTWSDFLTVHKKLPASYKITPLSPYFDFFQHNFLFWFFDTFIIYVPQLNKRLEKLFICVFVFT